MLVSFTTFDMLALWFIGGAIEKSHGMMNGTVYCASVHLLIHYGISSLAVSLPMIPSMHCASMQWKCMGSMRWLVFVVLNLTQTMTKHSLHYTEGWAQLQFIQSGIFLGPTICTCKSGIFLLVGEDSTRAHHSSLGAIWDEVPSTTHLVWMFCPLVRIDGIVHTVKNEILGHLFYE